jgi:hypothetical protein
MRNQLENRLLELKGEFELGQKQLTEYESQTASLRNMLLRISGAIQVLEEELEKAAQHQQNGQVHLAEHGTTG